MTTFHFKWTDYVQKYWSENRENFSGPDILSFLNILYEQDHIIGEYGMKDSRYKTSYNELVSTFCVRTFKGLMPMAI